MTYRCSTCAINYPYVMKYEKCLVCDDKTSPFSDLNAHEDWEERVKSALAWNARSDTTASRIADNRLARFRAAGLDLGRAMEFAGERDVDLHLFERLIKDGCDVDTAARIVAPLP